MGIDRYLNRQTSAAPLVTLRFGFGLMMFLSVLRFWSYGWIEKLYLQPTFFFSYRYFDWVKPLGNWTYLLFAVVAISALCVMVGYHYRAAIIVFFLSFTYVELMDKTTYLNHYYFISLLSLLLIFLPMGRGRGCKVPRWSIDALKLFVGVVYLYAGLAKLNSDWLLHAQPLAIWLPAKYLIPLLGDLLQERWVHFAFAWGGAAYDLAIPFFLLWSRTRVFAFVLVVIFHVLTRILFPIGMFPYVMIVSALVFFSGEWHERLQGVFRRVWQGVHAEVRGGSRRRRGLPLREPKNLIAQRSIIMALLLFHLAFPFRHLLYPGELFWTENGYRFSWRVMLMEKAGLATFRVTDADGDQRTVVTNSDHLSTFQEKQMSTQPDFILEFAHHLREVYREKGYRDPEVYVDSYVALNGRLSQQFVDPKVNLAEIEKDEPVENWLLDFKDDIYGF